jgi:hypothetical protein
MIAFAHPNLPCAVRELLNPKKPLATKPTWVSDRISPILCTIILVYMIMDISRPMDVRVMEDELVQSDMLEPRNIV